MATILTSNLLNITADQGSTFRYEFQFTYQGNPLDLTNWDARMAVRKTYGAASTILSASLTDAKIQKSVTIGEENLLIVTIPASEMAAVIIPGDDEELEAVYDIEVIDTLGAQGVVGGIYKGARGTFTIRHEVTR